MVELTNCKRVRSLYFVPLFVKVQGSKYPRDLPKNTENRFFNHFPEEIKKFLINLLGNFICPEAHRVYIGRDSLPSADSCCFSCSKECAGTHVITMRI